MAKNRETKYKYEFLELFVGDYTILIDINSRVKTLVAGRRAGNEERNPTYGGMATMLNPDGTPDLATDEEIEYLKSIARVWRYSDSIYDHRSIATEPRVYYRCAKF